MTYDQRSVDPTKRPERQNMSFREQCIAAAGDAYREATAGPRLKADLVAAVERRLKGGSSK